MLLSKKQLTISSYTTLSVAGILSIKLVSLTKNLITKHINVRVLI